MRYIIGTRNAPCTLQVTIQAIRPVTLTLQAYDEKKENTFLTNRQVIIAEAGKETCYIQMPLTPAVCGLSIFETSKGEVVNDPDFKVLSIKKKGLPVHKVVNQIHDSDTRSFIRFAERFCYNAGWLPSNKEDETYDSDDGVYHIKYMDIISDGSQEMTTPARINRFTKIIEVSKRKFVSMSVPERFCILCHEYAHLYMNVEEANELEADLNGLTLYLALGYPRIDALEVFMRTFYSVPTDANLSRFKHIENFIYNFDNYFYTNKDELGIAA